MGVNADNDAIGAPLLELPGNTGDGTTSAGANNDHVDLAITLLENLLSGAVIVGERVVGVSVLVENHRVGDLGVQPPGNSNVAFRGV